MTREFEWVQPLQRYRVTEGAGKGQFISSEAVNNLTLDYVDQAVEAIEGFTDRLLAKEISLASWRTGVAEGLKEGWINAWAIGIGGHKNISDRDRGRLTQQLKNQFQYLQGFVDDIALNTQSEAQIRSRAKLYSDGLYRATQDARDFGHRDAGFLWQRDTLNSAAESCTQCSTIAGLGWVRLGSTPKIGERICLSRDRCTREYSKEELVASTLSTKWGFIGVQPMNNRDFQYV